jgi:hypothetical protein
MYSFFPLQNGAYGCKLFSSDYTPQEAVRMTDASMRLNTGRNDLMRLSVLRYNATQSAFQDIMSEFTKCIDVQGVPHDFRAEYQENLRDLRQAFQTKWGAMISDLGVLEQNHRSEVDSMYSVATYALADELAATHSQIRIQTPCTSGHLLVRQHASSTGFKRPRSSLQSAGSESETSSGDESELAEAEAPGHAQAADGTGVKPETDCT